MIHYWAHRHCLIQKAPHLWIWSTYMSLIHVLRSQEYTLSFAHSHEKSSSHLHKKMQLDKTHPLYQTFRSQTVAIPSKVLLLLLHLLFLVPADWKRDGETHQKI
uniref:Uncharacterized protein n=1 Tax=Opuntia streptacantha TaxID=393608 RepID=A0A7C9CYG1_OPUST